MTQSQAHSRGSCLWTQQRRPTSPGLCFLPGGSYLVSSRALWPGNVSMTRVYVEGGRIGTSGTSRGPDTQCGRWLYNSFPAWGTAQLESVLTPAWTQLRWHFRTGAGPPDSNHFVPCTWPPFLERPAAQQAWDGTACLCLSASPMKPDLQAGHGDPCPNLGYYTTYPSRPAGSGASSQAAQSWASHSWAEVCLGSLPVCRVPVTRSPWKQ